MSGPPEPVHVPELAPPVGFSHAVASRGGHVVWLAGQNGTDAAGRIVSPGDLVEQLDLALANLLVALAAAGGTPRELVQLRIYVSDVAAYRDGRGRLGEVWRRHFGRYYPALALLGVAGFYDPEALVEVEGVAVLEEASPAAERAPEAAAGPGAGP
jgi:enamine deaminase RidA (YjgF/YER057c/UK114 family)